MGYRLELFDGATCLGQLREISDVEALFELEGENTLRVTVSAEDGLFAQIWGGRIIRLIDEDDPTVYNSFIIQQPEDDWPAGRVAIQCEGWKYKLNEDFVPGKYSFARITAAAALDFILQYTAFTAGTVNPPSDNLRDITFDCETVLAALQRITETWYYEIDGVRHRYYYRVNENNTVDILSEANIGTARSFVIDFDKNLDGMRRTRNFKEMANRVFGFGAEGFNLYRHSPATRREVIMNQWGVSVDSAYNVIYDDNPAHIVADHLFNGLLVYGTEPGMYPNKDRIAETYLSDPDNERPAIVLDTGFGGTPTEYSDYIPGFFHDNDEATYDVGLAFGDDNPLAVGRIFSGVLSCHTNGGQGLINWEIVIPQEIGTCHKVTFRTDWTFPGGVAICKLTLTLLDDADAALAAYEFEVTFATSDVNGPYAHLTSFEYYTGPNTPYVEDAGSIGQWGLRAKPHRNEEIEDTINLVATPAFDGAYTGGLCQDWTKVFTPTVTENTDAAYIKHGTKSQKVVANTAGQGLSQVVAIARNVTHSAYFNLYVDPAITNNAVLIQITDGTQTVQATTEGVGWIEMLFDDFSFNAYSVTVKILAYIDAAVFYADAAMLHIGAPCRKFVVGDSVDVLWTESYNMLQERKQPPTTYALDLRDLREVDPIRYAEHNFAVGDTVPLVVEEISLNTAVLVVSKRFDVLKPERCRVELGWRRNRWKETITRAIFGEQTRL